MAAERSKYIYRLKVIPSGTDKLVQEVTKTMLERIYEPIFSENSHGFRPHRSCHTALSQVRKRWTGIKRFIEFDIKGFDNIDHIFLLSAIGSFPAKELIKQMTYFFAYQSSRKNIKVAESWIYGNLPLA